MVIQGRISKLLRGEIMLALFVMFEVIICGGV